MGEWKEITLGELITEKNADLQTGPFGTMFSAEEYTDFGTPIIAVQDIGENKIETDKLKFIGDETVKRLLKYKVITNDIIFGRKGSTERRAIITERQEGWIQGSDCIRLRLNETINAKFISYQLGSGKLKKWLVQHSHGATMPSLNQEILSLLPLMLPPLQEQRAIASILSSLDDKIDLLHRQNKTLEAMAETLFRQWFVEEADEGWEERPLSSIAVFLNGLPCQKYPPKNDAEKLPVLKIKELSSGITDSSDWATSEVNPDYIVDVGDVIFSWSASLMVKVWSGEKCVLNQHLFKVTSNEFPKWFYLQWCKYHLAEFISISSSHATTMGHIKRGDLDNAKVLIPSPEKLSVMSEIMKPLLDKYIVNNKQIYSLQGLRDTLLPKLMNGEVRVEV